MKNSKITYILISLCLSIISCEPKDSSINVTGHVKKYPDSTMVVLVNITQREAIDTTYFQNEQFSFKISKMDTIIGRIDIGDEELVTFFLEDTDIFIEGQRDSFRYAKIKGGAVQNQKNEFDSLTESLNKRFDRVNYRNQGFEIISITEDEDIDMWIKATKKDSIIWTNLTVLKRWSG